MATMIRTTAVKILGDTPMKKHGIEKALVAFVRATSKEPEMVVLSPWNMKELHQTDYFRGVLDVTKYKGMELRVDRELKDDEFYVTTEESKTYEVED